MRHSWREAARHHPGGWLIALATVVLAILPGCGASPSDTPTNDKSKVDMERFGALHAPTRHWHEVRPDHPHRDSFAFEGGDTVPRADYRIRFRIRRERRHEASHHHHRIPRPMSVHGGKVLRVSATNIGGTTWGAPVILVFDQVAGGNAEIHDPCGLLPDGRPYLCLLSSGVWSPGTATPVAELSFSRGTPVPYKWHIEAMPVAAASDVPDNRAPLANAGPDQTAFVGDTVTLDGSASMDPDGDPLSFAWQLDAAPAGSTAALSDPKAVNPTIVPDVAGTYTLSLLVDDGVATSAPDTVRVDTLNSPPVADAGDDRTAFVGDTVTLDGTKSFDVDGDALAFTWTLASAPSGSTADLDDGTAVLPKFTIDRSGTYEFELVVSDGAADSLPDTVFVTTLNAPPRADAGLDQTVVLGAAVGLDGSGSYDPDGDPIESWWSLVSVPAGSAAALSDPAAMAPSFTADLPGTYVAQLIVSDGAMDSTPDTVTIDTANTRPRADAGVDRSVLGGMAVALDGTGSFDPDGDPMTFFWALTSVPAGSTAALDAPASTGPTFTADLPGDYLAQLIVNDGDLESAPDTVLVTALAPPTLSIGDVTVNEGDAGTTAAVFTVTRSGTALWDASVDYATTPGTALSGFDFLSASGTLTIPSGETSATITVDVVGDTASESNETFTVDLSNPVLATLSGAQGTGRIMNDDIPTVSIGDVTVTEGDSGTKAAIFPVTLSSPMNVSVGVQFASVDGSAHTGSDYLATSGVMTILAGRTTGIIAVAIMGDTVPEATESLQVNLISAGVVPIADGVGVATILDND
jgi:hypothetical protein